MRYWSLLVPLIFALNCVTAAQVIFPSPTPTPRPGSREAAIGPIARDKEGFDRLGTIDIVANGKRVDPPALLDSKKGIYRRPGKDEIAPLAVEQSVVDKYGEFLKQRDTGIVKLNANISCFSDTGTIVASEACLPFRMPGSGISYSFRTESYRLPRLSDLILVDGVFRTGGIYQHVILTSIGDVPLESITLESRGLAYLTKIVPAKDGSEYTSFDEKITAGVTVDGLLYNKAQPVKLDTTYAMRSIAYRGKYMRVLDRYEYNELDYDKRRDVIVAFRVVDRDAAGNITFIWKRLKDSEAPVLKVAK
jgi:hypothetical protein